MIHSFAAFNEAKNVGVLYHFTSLFHLSQIATSDCLRSSRETEDLEHVKGVPQGNNHYYFSFTRNKLLNRSAGADLDHPLTCRITVDGNTLSNKHKLISVNYFSGGSKHVMPYYDTVRTTDGMSKLTHTKYHSKDESEEALILNNDTLPNFSRFLLAIVVPTLEEFEAEFIHYAYNTHSGEQEQFMYMLVEVLKGTLDEFDTDDDDDSNYKDDGEKVEMMCEEESFSGEQIEMVYTCLLQQVKDNYHDFFSAQM